MNSAQINICRNIPGKRKRCILIIAFIPFIMVHTSCKKLVEAPPPTESIAESNAYSVDATAIAVLNDIYTSMNMNGNSNSIQGSGSISLFAGLSSDELTLYNGIVVANYLGYYQNALSAILKTGSNHWAPLYNYIFRCNAAIEGLSKSTTLTPVVKQQLLGEAKFMRAFFYFYLVNLFGDLPLVLTTDPEVNTLLARSSKAVVYRQIITDLLDAEQGLSSDYLDGTLLSTTTERVRPTKWAASALLARVYLYTEDWANAEGKANAVINNTSLFGPLTSIPLNSVFLKNSMEAIWQLQPTAINFNTVEAQALILPSTGPSTGGSVTNPVYLSSNLLNAFEVGDLRATPQNWIDTITAGNTLYSFPYKYKVNTSNPDIDNTTGTQNMTEYYMVLRLAEQYLIRAEARAQLGNMSGAQSDLNTIRNRAGLANTTAGDKTSLLAAILHERQVELFSEWGHRWFDLKRTNNVDAVMTVITPLKSNGATSWQSYQQLYPLPLDELQKEPNLVQNPGY